MKQVVVYLIFFIEVEKGDKLEVKGKILMVMVKGDVYDIGKNIVGVVFGCNGYDVVDFGVMVLVEKILQIVIVEKCDIIGLFGLIMLLLDEMVYVVKEMQWQNFQLLLMIGGVIILKVYIVVKIDLQYSNDVVVYVIDVLCVVGVVISLLFKELKVDYVVCICVDYVVVCECMVNCSVCIEWLSYEQVIVNKLVFDWVGYQVLMFFFIGVRVFDEIDFVVFVEYIDWMLFFIFWDLVGKYLCIFIDEVVGEVVILLFNDVQVMLKKLIDEKLIKVCVVFGFWLVNQVEYDDLEVYGVDGEIFVILYYLWQQMIKLDGKLNLLLVDFVVLKESGVCDYIGGFIIIVGIGVEEVVKVYEVKGDDYNSIMVKVFVDCFVEVCVEWLYEWVCKEYWGYVCDEYFDNEVLIKE